MSEHVYSVRNLRTPRDGAPRWRFAAPGEAQLFLAALLAGSGWLFSVEALKELPPLLFIGTRFVLAGLVLLALVGMPPLVELRQAWKGLFLSSLAMAAAMGMWIVGLKHTSHVGVAAFITAMGNLLVPVAGFVIFRWPIAIRSLISLAVAICGLALLFLDTSAVVESSELLFVASAILWAVSLVLVRQGTERLSVANVSAIQLVWTGVLVTGASLLLEQMPLAAPSVTTIAWFAASLLLSTCLRFVLQFRGQSLVSPARAGLMMVFEPAWAMAFAFLFVGTPVTPIQALGCAIIFITVAGEALFKRGRGT